VNNSPLSTLSGYSWSQWLKDSNGG
jgi:hypothetical protein